MSQAQWSRIVAEWQAIKAMRRAFRAAVPILAEENKRRRVMAKLCPNCGEQVKRRGKDVIFCTNLCCKKYHARKRKGERRVVRTIRRSASSRLPL